MIILFSEDNCEEDIISIIRKNIIHPKEEFLIANDRLNEKVIKRARIGICSNNNRAALTQLCENKTPVITCGLGCLNTVTLSSQTPTGYSVTLQREFQLLNGKTVCPAEYPIKSVKKHHPFTVMASATVMLLNGITPKNI